MINKSKAVLGSLALVLWLTLMSWALYSFRGFAIGSALGPMEAEWLFLPTLLALLSLVFLAAAYYLLMLKCRKWAKLFFLFALMVPTMALAGYAGYVSASVIAAPYFTTTVTTQIKLRLDLDNLNRPVFFFSDFHIKDGFDYDPYRKYLLEYPEEVFGLSQTGQEVVGTIVIEYSYQRASRFWLTYIGDNEVMTNRINGSFMPSRLARLEDMR